MWSNMGDEYISQRLISFVTHVFWHLVQTYRNFVGMYSRQIQGRTPIAASTLKLETVRSSEPTSMSTRLHDHILRNARA
jgi:hypothetical protein